MSNMPNMSNMPPTKTSQKTQKKQNPDLIQLGQQKKQNTDLGSTLGQQKKYTKTHMSNKILQPLAMTLQKPQKKPNPDPIQLGQQKKLNTDLDSSLGQQKKYIKRKPILPKNA